MKRILFAATGLALALSLAAGSDPASASHYQQQWYDAEQHAPIVEDRVPEPAYFGPARHTRPVYRERVRPGLDRPYGGHGVPYRTPPQGWPEFN